MPGGWVGRRQDRSSTRSKALRLATLRRDGWRCQWGQRGALCGAYADQADHINRHGPDELSNMRALCAYHHGIKTSTEGNAERWRYRRARDPEPHPGVIW